MMYFNLRLNSIVYQSNVPLFKLPRWNSPNLKKNSDLQLQIMVDASQVAFAAEAYIRITGEESLKSDIVFVMGKNV